MLRYVMKAYFDKRLMGLVTVADTDSWSEVEEFIWEHCQKGHYCTFVDRHSPTHSGGVAYPDLFTAETVEVSEIIVAHSFM